jgi:hypothetical protein
MSPSLQRAGGGAGEGDATDDPGVTGDGAVTSALVRTGIIVSGGGAMVAGLCAGAGVDAAHEQTETATTAATPFMCSQAMGYLAFIDSSVQAGGRERRSACSMRRA